MVKVSVVSATLVTVNLISVYSCVGAVSPSAASAEEYRLTALPSSVWVAVAAETVRVGASLTLVMVRV
jgi:hypothetical protein